MIKILSAVMMCCLPLDGHAQQATIAQQKPYKAGLQQPSPNPAKTPPTSPAPQEDQDEDHDGIDDPLEGLNRAIFSFNQGLNFILFRPLAAVYEFVVPDFMQGAIKNVLNHLSLPLSLLNDIFQFDGEKFEKHFTRLLINTGFGLGGLVDVCGMLGVNEPRNDFGKTLKKVGVSPGCFLMLPLLGPCNARDSVGKIMDVGALWPLTYGIDSIFSAEYLLYPQYALESLTTYVDYKGPMDQVEKNFADPYIMLRSLYYQSRQDLVTDDDDDEDVFSKTSKAKKSEEDKNDDDDDDDNDDDDETDDTKTDKKAVSAGASPPKEDDLEEGFDHDL